jgi:hypothetical protein
MVYWPEYVPPAVFVRAIVIPVGEFAVTVAPDTGDPFRVTRAVIVAVSPRLKTVFAAGAVKKMKRLCDEVVVSAITCMPLPVFPCVSVVEAVTTWDPVVSLGSTK